MKEFEVIGPNQNIDPEYIKRVGGVSEDLKGIGNGNWQTTCTFIRFTKQELEDIIKCFNECQCEKYIQTGDAAYFAFHKLLMAYENFDAKDEE